MSCPSPCPHPHRDELQGTARTCGGCWRQAEVVTPSLRCFHNPSLHRCLFCLCWSTVNPPLHPSSAIFWAGSGDGRLGAVRAGALSSVVEKLWVFFYPRPEVLISRQQPVPVWLGAPVPCVSMSPGLGRCWGDRMRAGWWCSCPGSGC